MKRTHFLLTATLWAAIAGCGERAATSTSPTCPAAFAAHPSGAAWQPPLDPSSPVATTFLLSIDPNAPSLASAWRQPQAEALTVSGGAVGLSLQGGVKRFAKHSDRLYIELTVVSTRGDGLGDVTLGVGEVSHAAQLYDLSRDPWAAAATGDLALAVGGIGPEGTSARIHFGVDVDGSGLPITMTVNLSATTTARVASNSAPLAVTPDGSQLWTTFADGDRVAIIDTTTDTRTDDLGMVGRPTSVALTPDGALALVTCASCNQLVVVDRATRRTLQIFGESEGIGRDPRHVVVSPDGARAYVSAYVGDSVTALERVGDAFRVVATIPVGRRPVGMGVTPDGTTLYVAHFLPHGPVVDNGGWVSIVDTDALAEVATAELRDDGNEKEASCLTMVAAFAGAPAEQLSFEATPTQLAGVFLTPGGGEAWVPALRVAGFPILEGDVSPLGFMFATLGANSPMMLFPLDTRQPRDAGFRRVGSVIDFTDRDESFLRCYPGTDDAEAVRARPTSAAGELQFPGVTIPSQATLLADSGAARFVGYSRGGR
ncbi:MAG TPA: YncE family protein, partial [Polyangia bacterium]